MLIDIQREELDRIIQHQLLTPMFQIIADTRAKKIFGYEALIRGPADSPLHSPYNLFRVAHEQGRLFELEYLCRKISAKAFVEQNLPGKLFLNISPMSLISESHRSGKTMSILKRLNLSPENVVIEISELYPLENLEIFRKATNHYRSMGFGIAIDDLGSGYAGLRVWCELKPDYVKIDRHFISDINRDPIKQEFVRSINAISRKINCKVVAEGIETKDELLTSTKLNLDFAQGYFFNKPEECPPREFIKNNELYFDRSSSIGTTRLLCVSDLIQGSPVINRNTSLEDTAETFKKRPGINTLPVCIGNYPLGVVSRHHVQEIISARYSRELHGRKPIHKFLNPNSIIVDKECSLNRVSQLITDNLDYDLSQDFIITDEGRYIGVGNPRELLKRITDQQLKNARYCNPLTQLPGNVPIYEQIDELLEKRKSFWVAYLDLNHFKPYNDVYGYSHGDEVIQSVAQIASSQVRVDHDFVGHIGGDDFVIIFTEETWQTTCDNILTLFAEEVSHFYNLKDLKNGGIWSEDRNGKSSFFSLLTLAIGVIHPDPDRCRSHHDVAELASDAKHQAKLSAGNSLFFSRRRGPQQDFSSDESLTTQKKVV
ncbi:MAG: GGDEF domain-containing protein [Pseudomonadales bacterium]|nr:GGDEF domain-containing protein [Pseudomonadales bacterium]